LDRPGRSGILRGTMVETTADPTAFPLGPLLDLLRDWWALNHAFERTSRGMAAHLGVTGSQRIALRVVGRYPGIGPGDLARVLHLDPGTVSAMVGRLERAGVMKRRPGGRDRRRVALGLTSKGRALDVADEQTLEGALARVLARVPAAEVAVVRSFLAAFVRELDLVAPAARLDDAP
jgi:DNA-binding MarR family transcriptional regulator